MQPLRNATPLRIPEPQETRILVVCRVQDLQPLCCSQLDPVPTRRYVSGRPSSPTEVWATASPPPPRAAALYRRSSRIHHPSTRNYFLHPFAAPSPPSRPSGSSVPPPATFIFSDSSLFLLLQNHTSGGKSLRCAAQHFVVSVCAQGCVSTTRWRMYKYFVTALDVILQTYVRIRVSPPHNLYSH